LLNSKSQIADSRFQRAFTLIEVLVAVAILAIALGAMGVIFRMSLDAYRASSATAEIMRKLRAITEQLNTDFKGLRKDGRIFLIWNCDINPPYTRTDFILFFANGDFQSYGEFPTASGDKAIRGNVARISYSLANPVYDKSLYSWPLHPDPLSEDAKNRILVRNVHILTSDNSLTEKFPDWSSFPAPATWGESEFTDYIDKNSKLEYDIESLEGWNAVDVDSLSRMLEVASDVSILGTDAAGGFWLDNTKPEMIHMLLAQGVGEFKIQSWYPPENRWLPDVDPDGDGILYPWPQEWLVADPGAIWDVTQNVQYPVAGFNQANFSNIPGLGRMLKFTFTLYDSRGFFKEGRTFTHIIYLDE
jgi:prepilin-type N-terminal cleavage/methylation domain-containing protein